MSVNDLKWLWKMSALVFEKGKVFTQKTNFEWIRIQKRRLSFIVNGMRLIGSLKVFMYPHEGSALHRAMVQRPELVGVVIWPYICSSWNARTCLKRIDEHFRVIELMGAILDFPLNESQILLDLSDATKDLKVILDQPKWFMREGLLVINLFLMDVRIFSLAFSFAFEGDRVVVYIGALQGADIEGILSDYKNLTKALHGMRPRDFLVELFRMLCRILGVTKIYAVNDDKRQHRSTYFGPAGSKTFYLNYNDIWEEREGVRYSDDFFSLSLEAPMKSADEVPSKKRAMYRRRYDLLQALEERMRVNLEYHTASRASETFAEAI